MAYEFVAKVEEKHQGTKLPYVVETPWDLTFIFVNKDEAERCARDLNTFLNAYGDAATLHKEIFKEKKEEKKEEEKKEEKKEEKSVNVTKPAEAKK